MRFVNFGTRRPSRLGCWQRWLTGGDASAVTCWALALLLRVMSGRSSRQQNSTPPRADRFARLGEATGTKAVPGRQRELFVVPTPTVRRGSAGVIASDESASLGCLLGLWSRMLGIPSVLHAASGPRVLKSPGKRQRRLPGLPREALATRSEERTPTPARGPVLRAPISQLFGFGSRGNRPARPRAAPAPPDPSVQLAQHEY